MSPFGGSSVGFIDEGTIVDAFLRASRLKPNGAKSSPDVNP